MAAGSDPTTPRRGKYTPGNAVTQCLKRHHIKTKYQTLLNRHLLEHQNLTTTDLDIEEMRAPEYWQVQIEEITAELAKLGETIFLQTLLFSFAMATTSRAVSPTDAERLYRKIRGMAHRASPLADLMAMRERPADPLAGKFAALLEKNLNGRGMGFRFLTASGLVTPALPGRLPEWENVAEMSLSLWQDDDNSRSTRTR
jgi:hypothetical protein